MTFKPALDISEALPPITPLTLPPRPVSALLEIDPFRTTRTAEDRETAVTRPRMAATNFLQITTPATATPPSSSARGWLVLTPVWGLGMALVGMLLWQGPRLGWSLAKIREMLQSRLPGDLGQPLRQASEWLLTLTPWPTFVIVGLISLVICWGLERWLGTKRLCCWTISAGLAGWLTSWACTTVSGQMWLHHLIATLQFH